MVGVGTIGLVAVAVGSGAVAVAVDVLVAVADGVASVGSAVSPPTPRAIAVLAACSVGWLTSITGSVAVSVGITCATLPPGLSVAGATIVLARSVRRLASGRRLPPKAAASAINAINPE